MADHPHIELLRQVYPDLTDTDRIVAFEEFEDPAWAEHGDPAFQDPETGLNPNTHGIIPGPLERHTGTRTALADHLIARNQRPG